MFTEYRMAYRAYSCGKGLEYHVSISHWPNSIADGHRGGACGAIPSPAAGAVPAAGPGVTPATPGAAPAGPCVPPTAALNAALNSSASLSVTPAGNRLPSVNPITK